MPQQYLTVITVADYGKGKDVISDPRILLKYKYGRQEDSPWMLYYAKWFDPWLMGNSLNIPANTNPVVKLSNIQDDIYSFRPNKKNKISLTLSLKRKFQFSEQYWYNWNLVQAINSYDQILPKRKIFVIRRVVSGSLGDNNLISLLKPNCG